MIKVNDSWQYVMNISKSIHLNLKSNEQVINFLNSEYSGVNFDIDIKEDVVYIFTENQLPCENCN